MKAPTQSPRTAGSLQQTLKDGPRVGVAHAGVMARVEAARMPQVAGVRPHRRAHIRALRQRSLEHTLLRVAGLAHVDDFQVSHGEVRAPLDIGAHAWSVENGVTGTRPSVPAGPALVANGGGKQVREEPVWLHAALHARAHGVAVKEVGQRVMVHAPGAGALPRRLEGSSESEAPGIKEQRALGSASAPDWPAHAEDSGQGGRRTHR